MEYLFVKLLPLPYEIACYSSFFLSLEKTEAQANLVPNPSFEDTIQFPDGQPGLDTWLDNIGTPDYFSAYYLSPLERIQTPINGRGVETPYEGVAYFGFTVYDGRDYNDREYMQAQLLDSLEKDEQYEVEFFISLADSFHWAVAAEDIGIYFSDSLSLMNRFDHKVREFRPFYTSDSAWDAKNKNGWEKFHYTYTAKGGENTLVIGCFKNDQEITLDSIGEGGSIPFHFVGSYYFIDQISVRWVDTTIGLTENFLKRQLQLYPNPVKEQFILDYSGSENLKFTIYNLAGQSLPFRVHKNENLYKFDSAHLPKGIYFLNVTAGEHRTSFKVVKR